MEEKIFKSQKKEAEERLRSDADPIAHDFYLGYIRGLMRHYHGDNFGETSEHHALESRKDARGAGYSLGLAGRPPTGGLTTGELAQATGLSKMRIRQLIDQISGAEKDGGQWRFPLSAIDEIRRRPSGPVGRPAEGKEVAAITVRMSPAEKNAFVKQAARQQKKVAAWMRETCAAALDPGLKKRLE